MAAVGSSSVAPLSLWAKPKLSYLAIAYGYSWLLWIGASGSSAETLLRAHCPGQRCRQRLALGCEGDGVIEGHSASGESHLFGRLRG